MTESGNYNKASEESCFSKNFWNGWRKWVMISAIVAAVVVVVVLCTGSTTDELAEDVMTDPQEIPAEATPAEAIPAEADAAEATIPAEAAAISTFGAKMKLSHMKRAEERKVYTWDYEF
jgi:hypothetical protein